MNRRSASHFINDTAEKLGLSVYSESWSMNDSEQGYDGTRLFYDFKDLEMEATYDEVTQDHLVKIVDVDYYLKRDRLDELISKSAGVMMYTSQPTAVAKFDGPASHTLHGKQFTEWYKGGATYQHKVWDWGMDTYVSFYSGEPVEDEPSFLSTLWTWTNGEPRDTTITVCQVERRRLGHKTIVSLVPRQRLAVTRQMAERAKEVLTGARRLERMSSINYGDGIYCMMGDQVSITQEGTRSVYSMSHGDFNDCLAGARTKNVSIAVLENLIGKRNAYHLRSLFLAMEPRRDIALSAVARGDQPRFYTPVLEDQPVEVGRVAGSVNCTPIFDGAFVPRHGPSSDQIVVEKRINKVRPVEEEHDFEKYLPEFLGHLSNLEHQSVPLDIGELLEFQTGKKKEAYAQAADLEKINLMWKSFQKTECYPEIKDPRNISNVDKRHVVRYLCFTQVVSQVLKQRSQWYAFGRNPTDTAAALHEMANKYASLTETDYSRYDGSLSQFLRLAERESMKVLFASEFWDELDELFEETLYQDIKTRYGIYYNNGSGRLSGSACTSVGNTIINAFCNYIVLRESGLSQVDSWDKLGFYGGDDGVTHYPDPELAEGVMTKLGLGFKASMRAPGEKIGFLGRFYIDPWTHSRSHHDVTRAAAKVHFSATSKEQASYDDMTWRKAVSLYATDSKTPVLGDWAKQVLRCTAGGNWVANWKDQALELAEGYHTSVSILAKFHNAPVYPGPLHEERDAILRDFIDGSPIDLSDYRVWVTKLRKAKKISEFPDPLWVVDGGAPKGDYPVLTGDAVVGPPSRPSHTNHCLRWAADKCNRGSKCKYLHDESKKGTAAVCRFYMRAQCTNEKCVFLHPEPCEGFKQGKRCEVEGCKYSPISGHMASKGKGKASH